MINVPHPPHNCRWSPIVDTSRPPPFDFIDEASMDPEVIKAVSSASAAFLDNAQYPMLSYAAIILRAKPVH